MESWKSYKAHFNRFSLLRQFISFLPYFPFSFDPLEVGFLSHSIKSGPLNPAWKFGKTLYAPPAESGAVVRPKTHVFLLEFDV